MKGWGIILAEGMRFWGEREGVMRVGVELGEVIKTGREGFVGGFFEL